MATDEILADYAEVYDFRATPDGDLEVNVIGQFALQFFAIVVALNEDDAVDGGGLARTFPILGSKRVILV